MVNMTTFFGMSIGAFVFWQSMDKVHVWIALHQDEKVSLHILYLFHSLLSFFFLYYYYSSQSLHSRSVILCTHLPIRFVYVNFQLGF
ncbi:hypothetical protein HanOQP8_Chr17g0681821 [Helianthus annuus]|nr:hypothetical protein HanOQP8_Chr17g0681821 [Helianthus annuus]